MALKNIPQAERLLSGTLTSYLSDVATTCVMSDPPSKFPTYIDLEPDSTTKKELIRAVAVSGSTVTIERSVNGVVTDHAANATYKQKITSRHWDAVSDALEKGLLMEDALRVLIRVSDTQFTITGYGASDDLTGTYTIGRVLRINSSASYVMTVTSSSYSAGTNKTTINVSATLPTPVSTVEFGIAPLGGTNLPLTSPTLTTPKITTSINDANGNEVIKTPATTSAVNEVTVTNSATGNAVQVSATGGDTDISLNLVSKGSGTVQMNGTPIISSSTDGWVSAGETWTYASASTFTIAGVDLTTKYTKGTRLKFTQTTVKYAVVVSSSFSTNTTVTIAVNTDYTIANAAISANYYSYQASPAGYPVAFAVTVTNGLECKLSIIGQEATLYGWSYLLQAGGGSTTVEKTITYGFTFASLPMVIAQNVGVKYTSAPTTISDLTTSVTGDGLYKSFAVHAITTTTFKSIAGQTGSAGADTYRAFSWIAKGNI